MLALPSLLPPTQDTRLSNIDKRMLRIKHKQHVPVAVWAHWISNHSYFKNLIVVLIVANALLLGVETELAVDDDPSNRGAIKVLSMLENISLVIFVLEIVIKMRARPLRATKADKYSCCGAPTSHQTAARRLGG